MVRRPVLSVDQLSVQLAAQGGPFQVCGTTAAVFHTPSERLRSNSKRLVGPAVPDSGNSGRFPLGADMYQNFRRSGSPGPSKAGLIRIRVSGGPETRVRSGGEGGEVERGRITHRSHGLAARFYRRR